MIKQLLKVSHKPYIRCLLSAILTIVVLCFSYQSWLSRDIVVSFTANSVKNIEYQIFYTADKKQSFNANQSVRKNVKSGKQKVEMVLPITKVAKFCFDFVH
jgi:hypothetical protein